MGMKKIDLSNWNRKDHFNFFKDFDEPFWGIVAEVDCTEAYKICKLNGYSFYAWYLHKSLIAVNSVRRRRFPTWDGIICCQRNQARY